MSIMKGKFYRTLSKFLVRLYNVCEERIDTLDPDGKCVATIKSINEKNKKLRRIKTCSNDMHK